MLVALGLALATVPASAAVQSSAAPAVSSHDGGPVRLDGDTAGTSAAARRATYAWAGRRITYRETLPAKWDWSLSTAIAKWNRSGGGIKFVRAIRPARAQLTISYGKIGSAAGLATVGRTSHAFVRLSSRYTSADSLDAHNRIEVMMVFAHELGHVLGFQHSQTPCSLMSAVLDVEGCGMIPAEAPGYYKCRTINAALVARFVRIYGGRAKYPAPLCQIDTIPAPLTSVDFAGGKSSPVTISWTSPASVPSGSRVQIHSWQSDQCAAAPSSAVTTYAPVTAGTWEDPFLEEDSTCFSARLVNRYGAGRSAAARLMAP
jgi:Matrixin